MNVRAQPAARVLWPVGIATCLSLLGDSTMYTVLPVHAAAAGIALASVGILLSANRFIRLIFNTPVGLLYSRWPRRHLFNISLLLGALASFIYAASTGFWPLLAGRLLWGLAWIGIWVGGNTIILDVSDEKNRGRLVGTYQAAFFLGAASGAILGGFLTDAIGYHNAMAINGVLALAGAVYSIFALPETRPGTSRLNEAPSENEEKTKNQSSRSRKLEFVSANFLIGINRLAVAGVVSATFALFLNLQFGDTITFGRNEFGISTVAGLGLGLSTLIAMFSVQIIGRLADRAGDRWTIVSGGLIPGILGFLILATAGPALYGVGLFLIAFTSGSNTGMSTTLVGDLSPTGKQGGRLGILFTIGDFGSAIGPILAFSLLPLVGLESVYILMAVLLSMVLFTALAWVFQRRRHLSKSRIPSI